MYEGKPCIVRTDRAGVFFARITFMNGSTADLADARRLWYWDGAASLSQLAAALVVPACTRILLLPDRG